MTKVRRAFYRKQRGLVVTRLLARDGDRCPICGEVLDRRVRDPDDPRYVTFDHVTPVSRGGVTRLDNLRLAHRACNERRGSDPLPAQPPSSKDL